MTMKQESVVFRSVITLPNTDYAHENIASNFRQALQHSLMMDRKRSETCQSDF